MHRLTAILLAASLLATPGFSQGRADSGEDVGQTWYQRARLGIAHVGQAGYTGETAAVRWAGSGFLVDRKCTVATALHNLEGMPDDGIVLRFLDPDDAGRVRTHPARVVWKDAARDLALLRFGSKSNAKRFCRSEEFAPLPLIESWDPLSLTGESVLVAGFPGLEGGAPRDVPIVRRGIVASAELEWEGRPMLLLDLTGVPGFSGGPVVLERTGEVIGMIYGPGRTRREYDFEWATPFPRAEYDRGISAAE